MTSVAVDELYLIAAESYAQTDDVTKSMKMLNDLLIPDGKLKHLSLLQRIQNKRHYSLLGKRQKGAIV